MIRVKKILCVCYGNTCRSPMFQALLSQELKSRGVEAVVESAGLIAKVGFPANEKAIICMKERGLDITNHKSRRVSDLDLPTYDNVFCIFSVITVINVTNTLIYLGILTDKIEFIAADDPFGLDIETYRACAETLSRKAVSIADKLAS